MGRGHLKFIVQFGLCMMLARIVFLCSENQYYIWKVDLSGELPTHVSFENDVFSPFPIIGEERDFMFVDTLSIFFLEGSCDGN